MARRLAVFALALATLPAGAASQARYLADAPGVWKPWGFGADADVRRQAAAQPADVKALDARLQELRAILKATPGFADPVGFSVEVTGLLDLESFRPGQPAAKTLPLPGTLNFGAYGISERTRNGVVHRDDTGETTQLLFFVNQLAEALFSSSLQVPEFEAIETDVTRLADAQPDAFGLPRYGHAIVITRRPVALWAPVSLDEALTLAVRGIDGRIAEGRAVVARIQKSHDDLLDPVQQARRIADYKLAASLSKDPNVLASLMSAEEKLQAGAGTLAAQAATASADVARIEVELAAAKARREALSTAERDAPACYDARASVSLARFKGGPEPGCTPLIRPNWALFDPALPRSAPQVLAITHFEPCLAPQTLPHPGGCVANRRLLESLDVEAIRAWLR